MITLSLRARDCNKLFGKVLFREDGAWLSFKCPRCSRRSGKDIYHNWQIEMEEDLAIPTPIRVKPEEITR